MDIKQVATEVYNTLGSGFSECVYHRAMEVLLRSNNIQYESERIIPINFKEHVIGNFRADLIVDKEIIIELKNIKTLTNTTKRQLDVYLDNTDCNEGYLINFPTPDGGSDIEIHYVKRLE